MEIKRKDVWGLLLVLLLGQLVAFSMAVASFASSFIANLEVSNQMLELYEQNRAAQSQPSHGNEPSHGNRQLLKSLIK